MMRGEEGEERWEGERVSPLLYSENCNRLR